MLAAQHDDEWCAWLNLLNKTTLCAALGKKSMHRFCARDPLAELHEERRLEPAQERHCTQRWSVKLERDVLLEEPSRQFRQLAHAVRPRVRGGRDVLVVVVDAVLKLGRELEVCFREKKPEKKSRRNQLAAQQRVVVGGLSVPQATLRRRNPRLLRPPPIEVRKEEATTAGARMEDYNLPQPGR